MNSEFKVLEKDGRSYLVAEPFEKLGVINGFSRRLGGMSSGKISGLNFGFRVGDDSKAVLENYRLLAEDLGFDIRRGVCARQMHTDNIRIVIESDCGKGIFQQESDIRDTDGLITNQRGIALIIFSADCVPLLFYDPIKQVIAASHAGWRGTVKQIGGKTVRLMKEKFGSDPKNIIAAIGPSIGKCCFEVDRDTASLFDEKYCVSKLNGKFNIDLWSVNRDNLVSEGLEPFNICISDECTICNSDKYYSYRVHKESTGRQVAVIALP